MKSQTKIMSTNSKKPKANYRCRECGWEGRRTLGSRKPCPHCGAKFVGTVCPCGGMGNWYFNEYGKNVWYKGTAPWPDSEWAKDLR